MLDFFVNYGADITALLIAIAGLTTAIATLRKAFNTGKKVDIVNMTTDEKIKITREGIVEAFKTAKIPTEWKISVSKQVNETLEKWRDDFITCMKNNQSSTNAVMLMMLKILSYTAASNKLTEEDKNTINELIAVISEDDKTIDIGE